MSIYSQNGTELQSAFSTAGTSLSTAYATNGAIVFSDSGEQEEIGIDTVQSYFRSETLSVAEEINALSDDWASFLFITDPHGSANMHHSQAIALYLLANTSAEFAVLNGDYSADSWSKAQYDAWVAPFLESSFLSRIYATIGNHETYGDGATAESKNAVYSDFLANKFNISGHLRECFYYFDDITRKIRYMFLNTSDSAATTMSGSQLEWLRLNAKLPDASWSLVVCGHVNIHSMGVTTMNESNGDGVISAIGACNGAIVGYFCGHQHIDGIYNVGKFFQTMLYCDRFENINYYAGYSVTNREAGTATEQAVSVISINPKTKNVVIRRIGVGRSRTLSYNYGGTT